MFRTSIWQGFCSQACILRDEPLRLMRRSRTPIFGGKGTHENVHAIYIIVLVACVTILATLISHEVVFSGTPPICLCP